VSYDAMRWALAQPVPRSSAKFVLLAMANCVNSDGNEMLCWPSTQHLSDATAQDRKTVLDNVRRLRNSGLIEDTGERRGMTGQVAVYRLKTPENGIVVSAFDSNASGSNKPETGTVYSRENGTGTENGTVPKTDTNSPEIPYKQSRNSLSTVPKTGHGTSNEPVKNQEGTKKERGFDAAQIDLPDWIDRESWTSWVQDRKARKKTITELAARLQLKQLAGYQADGYSPESVIAHSIAGGFQGLYPPRKRLPQNGSPSKHTGFAHVDYTEGVTNGIPDA
jgi:hypothetical protein